MLRMNFKMLQEELSNKIEHTSVISFSLSTSGSLIKLKSS